MQNGHEITARNLSVDYRLPFKLFWGKRRRARQQAEKNKNKYRALHNLSFSISPGERVGIVGLNGAGKTTLFRTLAGILYPAEGDITINNMPASSPLRKPVGYLSTQPLLYRRISGYENLRYLANLFHVDNVDERIQSVANMVGLSDNLDEYIEQYSSGMRARLDFARVFLPNPQVLILDEPFSSFDVHYTKVARDIIAKSKSTVLLATHNVEDIGELTKRIILIHEGHLVRDIEFEDLSEVGRTEKDGKVLSITEFVNGLLERSWQPRNNKGTSYALPA